MDIEPNPQLVNRQQKCFKPVFYGLIIASVLFAILISIPFFIRSNHRRGIGEQTQAHSNARQLGLALFEFESEYGAFPNATTIPLVEKENGIAIDLTGTSSNALLRQIFAADITESEQMFYARINGSVRPDSIITPTNILEPGECAFSYISGLSTKDDPSTPLALTPLIPGTTTFDPKPFNGKAIVLHIDCSVQVYDIA